MCTHRVQLYADMALLDTHHAVWDATVLVPRWLPRWLHCPLVVPQPCYEA